MEDDAKRNSANAADILDSSRSHASGITSHCHSGQHTLGTSDVPTALRGVSL